VGESREGGEAATSTVGKGRYETKATAEPRGWEINFRAGRSKRKRRHHQQEKDEGQGGKAWDKEGKVRKMTRRSKR